MCKVLPTCTVRRAPKPERRSRWSTHSHRCNLNSRGRLPGTRERSHHSDTEYRKASLLRGLPSGDSARAPLRRCIAHSSLDSLLHNKFRPHRMWTNTRRSRYSEHREEARPHIVCRDRWIPERNPRRPSNSTGMSFPCRRMHTIHRLDPQSTLSIPGRSFQRTPFDHIDCMVLHSRCRSKRRWRSVHFRRCARRSKPWRVAVSVNNALQCRHRIPRSLRAACNL